ncbi:L-lactate dehydrogenase [Bifidobacterium bohemicum]|uniref:L-lactate dehydrogenase n=1 Tax=Bifidobacterium bohemicum DSM 22767 TaxID=1437606 RepID=A0A086ZJN3_9BIFI|nr:lactate dehydrogenase [Bifidobacterium bohemicum]KFI46733.1 L-lactate dehydrogenase [Bifidobacterium bohemicum DSM 22767]SCB80073.1 L-lactate dehydrogenase [Bifidobacterium bohemicum]
MALIRKIGIVGQGHVGAHVANRLLETGIPDELYLCDINERKLAAEVQDLTDTLSFYPHNCAIVGVGDEYEKLAGCDVIVNAAGDVLSSAKSRDGELFVTTDIARTFVHRITDAGFQGIWVSIANPCDVIATEIWRLSGYDPKRIIGSGTALDSARLRNVISQHTGIDQHSINAYMLGEHGFSEFAAFSAVTFGGKSLDALTAEQPERFGFDRADANDHAVHNGYIAMEGKHCTEYSVASAACRIVQAVVSNEHYVTACSTLLTGEYGHSGLFASIPCVIGANGVEQTLPFALTDEEQKAFDASCAHIAGNIERLGDWWRSESRVK